MCKRMLAHERTQEIVRIAVASGPTQAKGRMRIRHSARFRAAIEAAI